MKARDPFPTPKSVSPYIPNVGDRVALVDHIVEHGKVTVAPGRLGAVIARICGVFEVQFEREETTRHVFQDQLTVLRYITAGGKVHKLTVGTA